MYDVKRVFLSRHVAFWQVFSKSTKLFILTFTHNIHQDILRRTGILGNVLIYVKL